MGYRKVVWAGRKSLRNVVEQAERGYRTAIAREKQDPWRAAFFAFTLTLAVERETGEKLSSRELGSRVGISHTQAGRHRDAGTYAWWYGRPDRSFSETYKVIEGCRRLLRREALRPADRAAAVLGRAREYFESGWSGKVILDHIRRRLPKARVNHHQKVKEAAAGLRSLLHDPLAADVRVSTLRELFDDTIASAPDDSERAALVAALAESVRSSGATRGGARCDPEPEEAGEVALAEPEEALVLAP